MVRRITAFLHSKCASLLVLAAFIIESLWMALSLGYPGSYDENYHLGIIQLYAQQWSPFFSHQPPNSDALGALTRDPSYLYHYLMSFPYRIVEIWTKSQFAEIVTLRIVDVAFVAIAIILFRQVLLKTRASSAIANVTLFFFILIPIVPFLAGQINYDTLLLPFTALSFLLTMHFKERLYDKHRFNVVLFVSSLMVSLLAAIVQYKFLPLLTAIFFYDVFILWRFTKRESLKRLTDLIRYGWHVLGPIKKVILTLFVLISLFLFLHAYGVNVVEYHNPIPQCNQVLTTQECKAYTPWERNYEASLLKKSFNKNPVRYLASWLYRMFEYSFYTSSGGANPGALYVNALPLPIISLTSIIAFIGGGVLSVRYRRELMGKYKFLGFLLFVASFYVICTLLRNYHDFLHTGVKVAINGRYLLQVIVFVELIIALAYREFLKNKTGLKLILFICVALLCLQGGGVLTFIDRSNSLWYWPHDGFAASLNRHAQSIVKPLIASFKLFH
jgi:hypothetical protein